LLPFQFAEIAGALRSEQVAGERRIDFADAERRLGRELLDAVVDTAVVRGECLVEGETFAFQALLERQRQLGRAEDAIQFFGELILCLRGEKARALAARGTG